MGLGDGRKAVGGGLEGLRECSGGGTEQEVPSNLTGPESHSEDSGSDSGTTGSRGVTGSE